MGKASRAKRKRAAVRSAKRAKNNNWWYGLTAIVLIAGVALIVYARAVAPSAVGPYALSADNTCSHGADCHWHAALGVYDCDHWVGDQTGTGLWQWPAATPSGSPARADNTSAYAGLHSHADGIIHMEPAVDADAGRHATLGLYFQYGGWKLSSSGYSFVSDTTVKNGDKCPTGGAGTLHWEVAKYDPSATKQQHYTVESGNPADYKLNNTDVVVVAFLPANKSIASIGDPPSLKNLPNAASVETKPGEMPTVTTLPTSTPSQATPTTKAAATPTTAATSTSKP